MINVAAVEGEVGREGRLQEVVVEVVQPLGGLLDTRVLGGEAGHEDGVVALGVPLRVDRALREDGHLVLVEAVSDKGGAVLEDVLGAQGTLDDDVDLGGPGVGVGGVEPAGANEPERHADAVADEGGEVFPVGLDGVAAVPRGDGRVERGVVEVVQVVARVGQEVESVDGRGGLEERVDQVLVTRPVGRDGDAGSQAGRVEGDVRRAGRAGTGRGGVGGRRGKACPRHHDVRCQVKHGGRFRQKDANEGESVWVWWVEKKKEERIKARCIK